MEKVSRCHIFFLVAVITSAIGAFFDFVRIIYSIYFFFFSEGVLGNVLEDLSGDRKYTSFGDLLAGGLAFIAILACIAVFFFCLLFIVVRVIALIFSIKGMQITDVTKKTVFDAPMKKTLKRDGVIVMITSAIGLLSMSVFGNPVSAVIGSSGNVLVVLFMGTGVILGFMAFICNFVMGILIVANEPDISEEKLENSVG